MFDYDYFMLFHITLFALHGKTINTDHIFSSYASRRYARLDFLFFSDDPNFEL